MPVAPPSGYANFGQRLVAQLLDGLLAFVAYIPAIVLFIVSFTSGHDGLCTNAANELYVCRQPNGGLFALAFLALALGLLAFIFYMSRRLGRTGQTPGKKVMGIKVVDKVSGQPIGAGRAFGRYVFAQFISGSFCALGYLWMLWDGEKQTWHDKVVSSIVVRA